MPGYLVHIGSTILCPHGGQVQVVPGQARVKVSGQLVGVQSGTYPVAGCAFTVPPGKPQPCVTARWLVPALRVRASGQPVVLQQSSGLCQSVEQIPQGPPSVLCCQARVRGI